MPEKPIDFILDDTHTTTGMSVLDNEPDIALGLKLPITAGNGTYFDQEYLSIKQVRHNIMNLILTMKNERIMQPTLGTNIYSTLFEQDDGTMSIKIEDSIRETLSIWLPFVKLEKLDVLTEGGDGLETTRNVFHISLVFSLQHDPTMLETVSFRMSGPEL
jgi:phage baseplate assembly protein W